MEETKRVCLYVSFTNLDITIKGRNIITGHSHTLATIEFYSKAALEKCFELLSKMGFIFHFAGTSDTSEKQDEAEPSKSPDTSQEQTTIDTTEEDIQSTVIQGNSPKKSLDSLRLNQVSDFTTSHLVNLQNARKDSLRKLQSQNLLQQQVCSNQVDLSSIRAPNAEGGLKYQKQNLGQKQVRLPSISDTFGFTLHSDFPSNCKPPQKRDRSIPRLGNGDGRQFHRPGPLAPIKETNIPFAQNKLLKVLRNNNMNEVTGIGRSLSSGL